MYIYIYIKCANKIKEITNKRYICINFLIILLSHIFNVY